MKHCHCFTSGSNADSEHTCAFKEMPTPGSTDGEAATADDKVSDTKFPMHHKTQCKVHPMSLGPSLDGCLEPSVG